MTSISIKFKRSNVKAQSWISINFLTQFQFQFHFQFHYFLKIFFPVIDLLSSWRNSKNPKWIVQKQKESILSNHRCVLRSLEIGIYNFFNRYTVYSNLGERVRISNTILSKIGKNHWIEIVVKNTNGSTPTVI